jgi:histidinol-phosphate aminotransferase
MRSGKPGRAEPRLAGASSGRPAARTPLAIHGSAGTSGILPSGRPAHGGLDVAELRRLGLRPDRVLDLSASLNPLGPSPRVRRALRRMSIREVERYPDPECLELREALARATGVEPQGILIGNGSTELIRLLAAALLGVGGPARGESAGRTTPGGRPACVPRAAILAPTFGEYQAACRAMGIEPALLPAAESDGFRWDIGLACRRLRRLRPVLTFLCNPNNPTGLYLEARPVRELAEAVAPGILAVDEAYRSFVEDPWDSAALLERGNVVLLRSLTKDHALAGLRLGYLLAPAPLVARLASRQPSWSVNAAAQRAGLAALADEGRLQRVRRLVARSRAWLSGELLRLGFPALPSAVNFLLARVGRGGDRSAAQVRAGLLRRGVCVRDCASFGLPEHIRVAVRGLADCRRLAAALAGLGPAPGEPPAVPPESPPPAKGMG